MSTQAKSYGIVVGVDGSPASNAAVCWAVREAVMRQTPLTLVHVVSPQTSPWAQAPLLDEFAVWQENEGHRILGDALKIAKDTAIDSPKTSIESELMFSATVPALVDLSRKAKLIAVGNSGRGVLARGLLASVSSSLVRRAHCPVAVIRDEEPRMPHPAQAPVL